MARAKGLNPNFNYAVSHNSVNTKVTAYFSDIIESKLGASSARGETYLDPKIFIFLVVWVDSDFAMTVGDIVEKWLVAQRLNNPQC